MEIVQRQERELQRLRSELDAVPRLDHQQSIERLTRQLGELRDRLRAQDATIQRLQYARVAETRPRQMKQAALDAFNISEHAERMARIARTLGDPVVRVTDHGPQLPRRVTVLMVWDIAWYEYCVKLDLGRAEASVHETGQGGDPTEHDHHRIRSNAAWRGTGLALLR